MSLSAAKCQFCQQPKVMLPVLPYSRGRSGGIYVQTESDDIKWRGVPSPCSFGCTGSITLAGDVTLYAIWTPVATPVTVTWLNGYSDTPVKTKDDHEKGAEVASGDYPANPTRPGYTFTGWGGPVLDEDGNITITAQWRRNNNGGAADLPDPTPTPRPTIPDTPTPLDPGTAIDDQEVPLAGAVGLNDTDHFAYVIGYPDDTVHPLGSITRAEAVTFLNRLLRFQKPDGEELKVPLDVGDDHWAREAVLRAVNRGDPLFETEEKKKP